MLLLPFLLLASVQAVAQQEISVDLQLLSFSPLTFLLTFSEPVNRPPFILLVNSFNILPVSFPSSSKTNTTNDPPASSFLFTSTNNLTTQLENYSIQFTHPLAIGEGRLRLDDFTVEAKKTGIIVEYPNVLSIFVVVTSYLLIYFTTLGHILIEFLQIYCLFMYHDSHKTSIYLKISAGMMMLNPQSIKSSGGGESFDYVAMAFPLIFIILTGAIGFFIRKKVSGELSLLKRILYEVGVYNLFISTITVFIFPLFFNSVLFLQLLRTGHVKEGAFKVAGIIISYLSIVLTFALVFSLGYAINPKWGESEKSWQRYLQSKSFDNYRKLYEGLVLNSWAKRNKLIISMIKRLFAVVLFCWTEGFQATIFILEFATIFYVFTVRPYKAQIYLNSAVVCRLIVFYFYGLVVLGNLYYSLGDFTVNYRIVLSYLNISLVVFLGIVIFLFLFIFYEIYMRCNDLNYSIRLVKEENEYKLKLIQKDHHSSHSKRKLSRPVEQSDQRVDKANENKGGSLPKCSNNLQVEQEVRNRSKSRRQASHMETRGQVRHLSQKRSQIRKQSKKWKRDNQLNLIIKN